MKTIGIIGAMEEEIALLKSKIEVVSAKNIVGVDFFMGKMYGKNVVIVRSGIGKVNAAICAQVLIDLYAVDYIINAGVAGAVHKDLQIGDVVISDDLLYHDFDTTAFGYPLGTIPRMSASTFKTDEELIRLAKDAGSAILGSEHIHIGRVVSGDQFIASKEITAKMWSDFKAYCVEMEGAAIAHTCYLNKLPFVVIRAISDNADQKAESVYASFMETAAKNTSDVVEEIIRNI